MKRTHLTIVLFVFVLAAALLPQALFAQGYTVCADEADPQSCSVRHAGQPAARQEYGPATHRTVCADDGNPQSCIVQSAQPYAARAQRTTASGAAEVDPSVTAGIVGIGSAQAASTRHSPSGGYGPHYTEQ